MGDICVVAKSPQYLDAGAKELVRQSQVQIDLRPEDTELLAKQHMETQGRLLAILKREMMEGRTGYVLGTDDKGLHGVRLSQKLIVSSTDINSIQRLNDAIQEIVVVACRCTEVLGQTFGSLKSCNADYNKTYSSIMYGYVRAFSLSLESISPAHTAGAFRNSSPMRAPRAWASRHRL